MTAITGATYIQRKLRLVEGHFVAALHDGVQVGHPGVFVLIFAQVARFVAAVRLHSNYIIQRF